MKKVDELLTQSEKYLEEMKINVADIRKEMTEVKRERAESKTVANDDKSSAITKSKQTTAQRGRIGPTYVDFKWMLSALGTVAAFYNAAG